MAERWPMQNPPPLHYQTIQNRQTVAGWSFTSLLDSIHTDLVLEDKDPTLDEFTIWHDSKPLDPPTIPTQRYIFQQITSAISADSRKLIIFFAWNLFFDT